MASRPAAGGGVWVEVGPDRFARWCDGFAQRHGGALAEPPRMVADDDACGGQAVELTAVDGSTATCCVPFPPLIGAAQDSAGLDSDALDTAAPAGLIGELAAHALASRTVGVLLVRRGGYAVGLFDGPRLTASKVGARHVQGRTKAGGWSQQRFARRREGQAREAYAAAADTAVRILLPHTARLDALIVGGDAGALGALRSDPRLKPVWDKEIGPQLNVGDPKMADLQKAPEQFRAIRIRLVERS
jgi:hypothetical protein